VVIAQRPLASAAEPRGERTFLASNADGRLDLGAATLDVHLGKVALLSRDSADLAIIRQNQNARKRVKVREKARNGVKVRLGTPSLLPHAGA
jgi:hypothetical protein